MAIDAVDQYLTNGEIDLTRLLAVGFGAALLNSIFFVLQYGNPFENSNMLPPPKIEYEELDDIFIDQEYGLDSRYKKPIGNYEHVNSGWRKVNMSKIEKELSKSVVGRETLEYFKESGIRITLDYKQYPNSYGYFDPYIGDIKIYVNAQGNTKEFVKTLIHETTHAKYGLENNSLKEEVICFIREHLHSNDTITDEEAKKIIGSVKRDYADENLPWKIFGEEYQGMSWREE